MLTPAAPRRPAAPCVTMNSGRFFIMRRMLVFRAMPRRWSPFARRSICSSSSAKVSDSSFHRSAGLSGTFAAATR